MTKVKIEGEGVLNLSTGGQLENGETRFGQEFERSIEQWDPFTWMTSFAKRTQEIDPGLLEQLRNV